MTQTRIITVAPQLAAVVRRDVPLAEMPGAQRSARLTLNAAIAAANLPSLGRTLTIWRPPRDGIIDYAPGVFVPHAFDTPPEVSLVPLPSGRAAHLRLVGPYDELPAAWGCLFGDCAAQGLSPAGLNWEIYAASDTPSDAIATDLYALLN